MDQPDSTTVPLSAGDMARFYRSAPAALRRRGPAFVAESLGHAFELVAMGAAPIVGLLYYDWSASQLLVFLLVGAWVGILADLARLALAGEAVQAFGNAHYEDWHVWVVANALRRDAAEVPRAHLEAKWKPWTGALVDLGLGGAATALIVLMFVQAPARTTEAAPLLDRKLLLSIAAMAGYQALIALWDIARRRMRRAEPDPLKATPGMRGLGLFLLVFVMVFVGDPDHPGGSAASRVMLFVNGCVVAAGLVSALGLVWARAETRWLQTYIRTHPAAFQPRVPEPESPAPRRPRRKSKRR